MANTSSLFGGDNYSQLLQNGLVFADGQDGNSGRRSKNFIRNRSGYRNTNGWAVSGACTVTRTTTAGEIVDGVASLKFAAGAVNDYVKNAFTINNIQKGLPLNISFDFITQSGVGGDWDIQIFDVTANAAISVAMPAQGGNSGNMPGGNGTFNAFFIASTNTSYELRIVRKGSGGTFTAANFDVFQQQARVGAPVTDWQAYTPVNANGLSTTNVGSGLGSVESYWRRVGDTLELDVRFGTSTTSATQAQWGLPPGLTIGAASGIGHVCGRWIRNSGAASDRKTGTVLEVSGLSYLTFSSDDFTAAFSPFTSLNGNTLFATTEVVSFFAKVQVAQWSSNIQMADRVLEEYAWNTSTSTTSDTTSFGNGSSGVSTQAFAPTGAASIQKRVRFTTPVQSTDRLLLEFSVGNYWVSHVDHQTYPSAFTRNDAGTQSYGALIVSVGNTTDFDVYFYSQATPGIAWGTGANWRVRKVSSGAQIGGAIDVGNLTQNSVGNGYLYEEGSFITTLTGCTTAPTMTVYFSRVGKSVTLSIPGITATSNATTCTLTGLPTRLSPTHFVSIAMKTIDNNITAPGLAEIAVSSTTITLYNSLAGAVFTASGTKGVGTFTLTYTLA